MLPLKKVLRFLLLNLFIPVDLQTTVTEQLLPVLKRPVVWFGMAYAMLVVVAVLSLIPVPDIGVEGSDKLIHFFIYFILSSAFTTLVRYNHRLLLVACGLISYGILIEFLQGMTAYRSMEAYDMLANSVGVLCGLLIRVSKIPTWFRQIELQYF